MTRAEKHEEKIREMYDEERVSLPRDGFEHAERRFKSETNVYRMILALVVRVERLEKKLARLAKRLKGK